MKAKLVIDQDFSIGPVDKRIFGSFAEHLGRCIYTGLYEPKHPLSDESGFRRDVLDLVRELQIPLVRYPGGNFVSGYRWEDGVGPKEARPVRVDCAWHSRESNAFGLNEFAAWCRKANAEPMMALNLGTRGIEAALDLLEYCNHPSGTFLSDLRISHGAVAPHHIRIWCLGNEMDGPWQIGHKTAAEYGRLAYETGKAMKRFDPDLQLVSCGSSGTNMATFPEWERETLMHTYDVVDYISLHQYFSNEKEDTPDFLACNLGMEHFISVVGAVCDYVQAVKRSRKKIYISFDEWNVWFHSHQAAAASAARENWPLAPALLEDIYTMEDALVVGCALITLLKHADRVKIACLAQLVNVIAPIMTKPNGGVCRQTIFYPFLHVSQYGRGEAMSVKVQTELYDSANYTDVPYLEATAVSDQQQNALTIFAVNRNLAERMQVECVLKGFAAYTKVEHIAMSCADLKAVNTVDAPCTVYPRAVATASFSGGHLCAELAPASWNVIRLSAARA